MALRAGCAVEEAHLHAALGKFRLRMQSVADAIAAKGGRREGGDPGKGAHAGGDGG